MLTIRRATSEDAPGIARVHVEAWREAYAGIVPDDYLARLSVPRRTEMWREILEAGGALHVAAAPDGGIVGFANSGPSRSAEWPEAGEIYALYLLAGFHGQGIGRILFTRGAADQIAAGRRTLILWVLADNPTLGFYDHLGGVRLAAKNEVIGGAALVELALGWSAAALTALGNRAPSS